MRDGSFGSAASVPHKAFHDKVGKYGGEIACGRALSEIGRPPTQVHKERAVWDCGRS